MTERKLITAEGYTLSAEQEDAVLARMRGAGSFTATIVIGWLLRVGVPELPVKATYGSWGPAHRIADRLLQRERKAGCIRFARGTWRMVTEPAP